MSQRHLWPAAAVAACVVLLASPGLAQALDPQARVTTSTPALSFDEGATGTQSASWTVTNAGPAAATAQVTLRQPAGWTASLASGDSSFSLAAGASRTIQVPVSPATNPPTVGDLVLSATMTDGAGRTSPAASAAVPLAFVPAPIPPAPRDYTTEIVTGVVGCLTVLALATVAALYVGRARKVALFVEPKQRPITTGTDGIFLVEVQNLGRVRREVELRVDGLPASWYGAFSFPKVVLQPGERSPVPLCIKVPREAGHGLQVELVLSARPSARFPWLVHATTRIESHDHIRIGPAADAPQARS